VRRCCRRQVTATEDACRCLLTPPAASTSWKIPSTQQHVAQHVRDLGSRDELDPRAAHKMGPRAAFERFLSPSTYFTLSPPWDSGQGSFPFPRSADQDNRMPRAPNSRKRLQDPGASHNAPRGLWGFRCIRRLIGCFLQQQQQQGGSWAEELVPCCGAWNREVFQPHTSLEPANQELHANKNMAVPVPATRGWALPRSLWPLATLDQWTPSRPVRPSGPDSGFRIQDPS
jgi:hypothetical protein